MLSLSQTTLYDAIVNGHLSNPFPSKKEPAMSKTNRHPSPISTYKRALSLYKRRRHSPLPLSLEYSSDVSSILQQIKIDGSIKAI